MKIVIYDRTALFDLKKDSNDFLAYTWMYGSRMFKLFNSLDITKGVASWDEAIEFLIEQSKRTKISGIQFWGHGMPGAAIIGAEILNEKKVSKYKAAFSDLGSNMTQEAYWWWRTCGTYGQEKGKSFAEHFTKTLGKKTAGHTHVIGFWQSGGHIINPGEQAGWPSTEGFDENGMIWSDWYKPNTITCMQTKLPKSWEQR